jgi:hypothetical protein
LPDVEPLCTALEGADQATRTAAVQTLRHLVGALLAPSSTHQRLLSAEGGPWCALLERVSRHLSPDVAYSIRPLLATLCEHPETFTTEQRAHVGETARRLLTFAWASTPRDPGLVDLAIEAVCRTFESHPSASAALVRQSLEPAHLATYGFQETPRLAREVRRLIPLDAELVEEIYRKVFAHRESSQESTPIGTSRILSMSSNRRQVNVRGSHSPKMDHSPPYAH